MVTTSCFTVGNPRDGALEEQVKLARATMFAQAVATKPHPACRCGFLATEVLADACAGHGKLLDWCMIRCLVTAAQIDAAHRVVAQNACVPCTMALIALVEHVATSNTDVMVSERLASAVKLNWHVRACWERLPHLARLLCLQKPIVALYTYPHEPRPELVLRSVLFVDIVSDVACSAFALDALDALNEGCSCTGQQSCNCLVCLHPHHMMAVVKQLFKWDASRTAIHAFLKRVVNNRSNSNCVWSWIVDPGRQGLAAFLAKTSKPKEEAAAIHAIIADLWEHDLPWFSATHAKQKAAYVVEADVAVLDHLWSFPECPAFAVLASAVACHGQPALFALGKLVRVPCSAEQPWFGISKTSAMVLFHALLCPNIRELPRLCGTPAILASVGSLAACLPEEEFLASALSQWDECDALLLLEPIRRMKWHNSTTQTGIELLRAVLRCGAATGDSHWYECACLWLVDGSMCRQGLCAEMRKAFDVALNSVPWPTAKGMLERTLHAWENPVKQPRPHAALEVVVMFYEHFRAGVHAEVARTGSALSEARLVQLAVKQRLVCCSPKRAAQPTAWLVDAMADCGSSRVEDLVHCIALAALTGADCHWWRCVCAVVRLGWRRGALLTALTSAVKALVRVITANSVVRLFA